VSEMILASMITEVLMLLAPLAGSMLLVFGIFQVVMDMRSSKKQKVLDRLRERSEKAGAKDRETKDKMVRRRANEVDAKSIESLVAKLSFVPKLQTALDQANIDWSASRMLVNLAALATLATGGLVVLQFSPLTGLAAGMAVMFLPILHVFRRRKKRMRKLVEQLPDAFELMGQALRAGHSLASGLHLASEQLPDPIGTEFARVFHEQNLGIKVDDALQGMADRSGQMDVRFFVTAVCIQRQTGGDLAEVLDKMGTVIRDRIALMGTVQALTAEGRLSGWVLLALPIIVFFVMLWMNYDYGSILLFDPTGRLLTFGALGMQLMGLAMIKKIVNIKV